MNAEKQIQDFLTPLAACGEYDTLEQALDSLHRGDPVAVRKGGRWRLLCPQRIAGYPLSRRVIDLPLCTVPLFAADLPAPEALDVMAREGASHALVVHEDQVLGMVLEKQVRYHLDRERTETVLRQSEQRFETSEERYRLITELTSDWTYTYTVAADGSLKMDSVTEGFFRVTGYTPDELRAHDWASLIHPDDLPAAFQRHQQVLAGNRSVNDLRIVVRSGAVRWIRYSVYPIWHSRENRVVRIIGAVQDITERKQAEEVLHEQAQRLQTLSRRLLKVQEEERRRLACELHDEIGQLLTGLQLTLEMGTRQGAEEFQERLSEAQTLVKELTRRVRDLSLRLRPTMLDDLGLVPALVWLFEKYTAQTGVQVIFEHRGLEKRFHPEAETAAYRIIQEALTNVARHAGAHQAVVRLWLDQDDLFAQIEDQGVGFDVGAQSVNGTTGGLSGMQERTLFLGGRLTVESHAGQGTRLTAELPIHGFEKEENHG